MVIPLSQKHCGNLRVRYCKCKHDRQRHFQGYSGCNTGNCKDCDCKKYEFGEQVIYKV